MNISIRDNYKRSSKMKKPFIKDFTNQNKIRDLFKVKHYTIRSETKKRAREREK